MSHLTRYSWSHSDFTSYSPVLWEKDTESIIYYKILDQGTVQLCAIDILQYVILNFAPTSQCAIFLLLLGYVPLIRDSTVAHTHTHTHIKLSVSGSHPSISPSKMHDFTLLWKGGEVDWIYYVHCINAQQALYYVILHCVHYASPVESAMNVGCEASFIRSSTKYSSIVLRAARST